MKTLFTVLLFTLSLLTVSAAPVTVFNCGIGGHNSRQGNQRLVPLLQQIRPQVLVIGYGGNDAWNSKALVSPENFRRNFENMIAVARQHGVRVIMLNTASPAIASYVSRRHRYPDAAPVEQRILPYNDILRKLAAQHQVLLNDFYQAVEQRGGATEAAGSLIRNSANSRTLDGLHLTPAGARLLGELAADGLRGHVKAGDKVLCLGDSNTWGAGLRGAGTVTGETYPAWLQTRLNHDLGLSTKTVPDPYRAPVSMQIPNADFQNDSLRSVPQRWVPARNTGSVEVCADDAGKNRYLRLAPAASKVLFLRTDLFPGSPGKWILTLQIRGAGEFQVALTAYVTGEKTPVYHVITENWSKQNSDWQSCRLPFSLPPKTRQISLIIRQSNGKGDFRQMKIMPDSTAAGKVALPPAATVLKNSRMSIEFFAPAQGGGIRSIRNAEGTEFVNRRPGGALWSMKLKKIHPDTKGLPPVVPLSIDPEQDDGTGGKNIDSHIDDLDFSALDAVKLGARPRMSVKDGQIHFFWEGIRIGGESGALDVWTKAEFSADGTFCMIDGGFTNRSTDYTVFYFALPQLDGLGALHGAPANDRLATPFFNGRLIANPVEKGLLGKDRIFQPNRSGHSMQFDALYNAGSGLHLASFDPNQCAKRYHLTASKENGVGWAVFNIPDNMRKVPQQWTVPYRSGFCTFRGDWYDSCMIYRDWALRQYWCAEGPEITRKSTPLWFKEIDEWFQLSVAQAKGQRKELEQLRQDLAGYDLGAWVTYWGLDNKTFHALNPDRFPFTPADEAVMKFLKENRIRPMGYLQCIGWSNASPSYRRAPDAEQNLVRNYYGQMIKWPTPAGQKSEDRIAYPGKLWRQALGDVVVQMAKSGFSAVYLDSGNHGGTYLNFTPACSGESGGGSGYVKGNQALLAELRRRARQVNPEFCFTSESFWEGNIAHLDGYLVCNTTNAYLEGDRVTPIPMVQAVYHDYTIMYSAWTSRWDLERDNGLAYVAKHALAFCWGVKPGWNILNLLYRYDNHPVALSSSLRRYAAYRTARKFLVYGQMLRPPVIRTAVPAVPVKWCISYRQNYFSTLMSPVPGNTWRAPDGSFALVLYNITEQEQPVSVTLDRKTYQLGNGTFRALYPAGQSFTAIPDANGCRIQLKVPPQSPVILELTGK